MKRKNIIAFSVALMAIGAFTSCSDEFLQDKKNYDYVDASTYNTFSGAKARVDDIYAWCLPNTSSEPSWKYNSTGAADLQSKSSNCSGYIFISYSLNAFLQFIIPVSMQN